MTAFLKYTTQDRGLLQATDDIFKDFYDEGVRDYLQNQTILSYYAYRNRMEVSGRQTVMAARVGRNMGGNFVGEDGELPEPGRQEYINLLWRTRYVYHRMAISGQAIASSRNSRGAFTKVLDAELVGGAQDRMVLDNQIFFSNSAGAIARVAANVSGGNVVILKDPGGFTNLGPGPQYAHRNMRVAFVNPATGALRAKAGTITAIDLVAKTITLDGAAFSTDPPQANDLVVVASKTSGLTTAGTSYGLWPNGLASLIDDQNIAQWPTDANLSGGEEVGGVDADNVGVWNSFVIDKGTARPLEPDMIEQGMNGVHEISGTAIDLLLTNYGPRRQYLQLLQQQKEYPMAKKLDAGWEALDYNGTPLLVDKDCTHGRMYGLSTQHLKMLVEMDYQFQSQSGTILRTSDTRDQYVATLFSYFQFITDRRNAHFVIKDIMDN